MKIQSMQLEKVDIEDVKVDIEKPKVDIESVLLESGANFLVKTRVHIHRLFEKFGFDEIFGRDLKRQKSKILLKRNEF